MGASQGWHWVLPIPPFARAKNGVANNGVRRKEQAQALLSSPPRGIRDPGVL